MRLLNAKNGDMVEFFDESIPKRYAVLSHRWGDDEVSYHEWLARSLRPELRDRHGYHKIQLCCNQAIKDKIDWVWIDTCCIDKTSSQELSEAINSMFRWYRRSTICYAYLYDYKGSESNAASLAECEWFFRGWTLQELIAPRIVDFYNKDWQRFGSKSDKDVCKAISEITNIDAEFLLGADVESASVAKRMSWASKRKTSRTEDVAYCLLGIFDINMPLLYGEGHKAFHRLQEEILKTYPADHSLYAWGIPVDRCSVTVSRETVIEKLRGNDGEPPASPEPLYGLLARSPRDFEFSRNFSPNSVSGSFYMKILRGVEPASYPAAGGKGVRIELPTVGDNPFYYQFNEPSLSQVRYGTYAVLLCRDTTNDDVVICLPLLRWGPGYYARTRELYLAEDFYLFRRLEWAGSAEYRSIMTIAPERKVRLRGGDVVLRSIVDFRGPINTVTWSFSVNFDHKINGDFDNTIRVKPDLSARYYSLVLYDSQASKGLQDWSIILGRTEVEGRDLPAFQAGIAPRSPDQSDFTRDFICDRIFQEPLDIFTLDLEPYPEIEIRVERLPLPKEEGFVDVVDIAIRERKPSYSAALTLRRKSDGQVRYDNQSASNLPVM
ncbi:HET-domain-containing protein [Hypoxylon sp. FL1857]|nr:HET-domain-containing protein [Hypoxylon sp. FL1857]